MTPRMSVGNVNVPSRSLAPVPVAATLEMYWLSTTVPAGTATPVRSWLADVYVPGVVMSTLSAEARVTPCCSFQAHMLVFDSRPVAADAGGTICRIWPDVPEIAARAPPAGTSVATANTAVNAATSRPVLITCSPPRAGAHESTKRPAVLPRQQPSSAEP